MYSRKQKEAHLKTPGKLNDELKYFIRRYKIYLHERQAALQQGDQIPEPDKRTKAIQEFEQLLSNPTQNQLAIQKKLDRNLIQIIDRFFSLFILKSKKDGLIKTAFRKTRDGRSLSYVIVLKEDNFKNRNKVLDFLTDYYFLQFYYKIPVYFQFITEEMQKKFYKSKKPSLNHG